MFIDVDFLLNTADWERADDTLRRVRAKLVAWMPASNPDDGGDSDDVTLPDVL